MTTYRIEVYKENEDDEDGTATWDAEDWCFMLLDEGDEIVCICATKGEAEHILQLLTEHPYNATTATSQ